jgi:chromosome segregation ATPase
MSDDGERHGTSDDEDDYDKRCSEYIIALRQELSAMQADLSTTKQCRHREKVQLDLLRVEQRRLQHQVEKVQTRLELERQVEQLQAKVARQQEQLKLSQSSSQQATCTAQPLNLSTRTIGSQTTTEIDGALLDGSAELAFSVIAAEPKSPGRRLRRVDYV